VTLRPIPPCAFLVLVSLVAAGAQNPPDDPIAAKLDKAADKFIDEEVQFHKAVLEALAKREEDARKGGNAMLLDTLQAELIAFDQNGELPKSVDVEAASQRFKKAKLTYAAALEAAIKDYVKANQDAKAAEVDKRLEEHLLITYPYNGRINATHDAVWTFTRNSLGALRLRCSYVSKGKEVGDFTATEIKWVDGKLHFLAVSGVLPNKFWGKLSQMTVTFKGDKLFFDWSNELGERGSREMARVK
jgi:hypothetical protein